MIHDLVLALVFVATIICPVIVAIRTHASK